MDQLKSCSQKIKDRLSHFHVKDFEIYIEAKRGTNIEVKESECEAYETKEGLGFGLRILKDQKLAFSYGLDFSDTSIDFVIKNCLDSLPFLLPDPLYQFSAPSQYTPDLQLNDPLFSQITYQQKLDLLLEMEALALKYDPRVKDIKHLSLDDEAEEIHIENSNGVSCFQSKTAFCASMGVQAENKKQQEIAYDMDSQVSFDKIQYQKTALCAAEHAVNLLKGKAIKHYKGAIIFKNDVVIELLDVLSSSFFAQNVFYNKSFLTGKLGHKLYQSSVQIMDNGLLVNGMGSGMFDSEGLPKQKTVLVQNGVLQNFLFDLYWAKKQGVNPTGNSCRDDLTTTPEISYSNFYLEPGKASYDKLVQQPENVLVITDMIGLHNADEVSGNFSIGIQGFFAKNRQKQHAIKSMVFSGNLHDILKNIVEIGSDLKFSGGLGAPSILVGQGEAFGE